MRQARWFGLAISALLAVACGSSANEKRLEALQEDPIWATLDESYSLLEMESTEADSDPFEFPSVPRSASVLAIYAVTSDPLSAYRSILAILADAQVAHLGHLCLPAIDQYSSGGWKDYGDYLVHVELIVSSDRARVELRAYPAGGNQNSRDIPDVTTDLSQPC